jgi:hypothetical protein
MLTETGLWVRMAADKSVNGWDKFKKGVIWEECSDGMCYTVCFPNWNGYFKYFILPDLLSDRMTTVANVIKLSSGETSDKRPMNKILLQMGARVRVEGNLCIYTFAKELATSVNLFKLMNKKERWRAITNKTPVCLIDSEGVVRGCWSESGLTMEVGNKLVYSNMPVEMK